MRRTSALAVASIVLSVLAATPVMAKPHPKTFIQTSLGKKHTSMMRVHGRKAPAPHAKAATSRPPVHHRSASRTPVPQPHVPAVGIDAFGGSTLVADARRYLGTNPTGRSTRWCGAFLDKVLRDTGHRGGGDLAKGYLHYGRRVSGPQVGAIAVMGRRGGGHVGVVSGVDANGNPIVISGNTWDRDHRRRVLEHVYPRSRIIAYVMPNDK